MGDSQSAFDFRQVPGRDVYGDRTPLRKVPKPFENHAGIHHAGGHDTEILAAASIESVSGRQCLAVFDALKQAGDNGCTDYEIFKAVEGLTRACVPARRLELVEAGVPIVKSDLRRTTDTGRTAIVWKMGA